MDNPLQTEYGPPELVRCSTGPWDRENDWNGGWKFHLGDSPDACRPGLDDSAWTPVELPHDFSIFQPFSAGCEAESGFLPGGTGWYRKAFRLPAHLGDKTLLLNFDGAYADAYVYVNGKYVGENHYGYISFAFDLTDCLVCDGVTENLLAVKVENPIPSSRWYSGSGLYRSVTLLVLEKVHAAHCGVRVTTPDIGHGSGAVRAEVTVQNDTKHPARVTVTSRIHRKGSDRILASAACQVAVPAGGTALAAGCPVVPAPALWSPEDPALYTLSTELTVDGAVTDRVETVFGFRYFSFDAMGFHLNGRPVKLQGMCLHPDQGALGTAAYPDAIRRQLVLMKDMGANCVRTSHNPPARQFMELCQELGLMVVEDSFDAWSRPRNGNVNDFSKYFLQPLTPENRVLGGRPGMQWCEFAIRAMVRRDRNCPSLILWSLANEIQEGGSTDPDFPKYARNLITWLREEDPTRPTTVSDNTKGVNPVLAQVVRTVYENGGIVGYNYASPQQLDEHHRTYPVILSSETSSAVKSRGRYMSQANAADVDGRFHLTSYDTSTVGWGMTAHDSMYTTMTRDFVAGEFVWTGFDYIGEPTPWNGTGTGSVTGAGAVPNSSYFGIVETTGFPKDTYYFYRSQWNRKGTTLHLVTAWDRANMCLDSGKTPVWLYTNAPRVELYRDGELLGTAIRTVHTTPAGHRYFTYATQGHTPDCVPVNGSGAESLYAAFLVSFRPGTVSAKAWDEAGNPILETTGQAAVTTPGPAACLSLEADRREAIPGGLVYVTAGVTDRAGNPVTTACHPIRFTLTGSGTILGVDNGDQATTDKFQQPTVLESPVSARIDAYAGKALVIVRTGGSFTLEASAPGLCGAAVTVNAADCERQGLVGCRLVRHYTVPAGTRPVMDTHAAAVLADGGEVAGAVTWEAVEDCSAGDHPVRGTAVFRELPPQPVTAWIHAIPPVAALRNLSAAVAPGAAPSLPAAVPGVLADGTLTGAFPVTWEPVDPEGLAEAGQVVPVHGEARILGRTLPVTASVRVAQGEETDAHDIAPEAAGRAWDGAEKTLTLRWDTAHLVREVRLPEGQAVSFAYSLNGVDFTPIAAAPGGAGTWTFPRTVNPIALRMTLERQCVPQVISRTAKLEPQGSAALSALSVDGRPVAGFTPDVFAYTARGRAVTAASAANAGITILPPVDRVIRILTVSEDGKQTGTYRVCLDHT